MGIARAYKAPSLYQTNPNYILYSKGRGCYASKDGCYLQGNDDLKAETSINKEIGLEFKRDGWLAGVTWFRNDYRNKIEAGYAPVYQNNKGTDLYQWENVPESGGGRSGGDVERSGERDRQLDQQHHLYAAE